MMIMYPYLIDQIICIDVMMNMQLRKNIICQHQN